MATTLFHYRYRHADNYKAFGVIALNGELDPESRRAVLAQFEENTWFVAEQLNVPPLYRLLYRWSGGPTSADHCWHEFIEFEVVSSPPLDAPVWGKVEEFAARVLAVNELVGRLTVRSIGAAIRLPEPQLVTYRLTERSVTYR